MLPLIKISVVDVY